MSHSTAACRFSDGLILYCEYNGTSDVMLPHLYDTQDERDENWRCRDWKYCTCGNPLGHEEVILAASYGGGFSWHGKACRECKVITDNYMPFDECDSEREDGLPDWYPNRELY